MSTAVLCRPITDQLVYDIVSTKTPIYISVILYMKNVLLSTRSYVFFWNENSKHVNERVCHSKAIGDRNNKCTYFCNKPLNKTSLASQMYKSCSPLRLSEENKYQIPIHVKSRINSLTFIHGQVVLVDWHMSPEI